MSNQPRSQKLVIFDGLNIVRRYYEGSQNPDPAEKVREGLRGAYAEIRRLLGFLEPTHAVMALDAGGITWRHDLYPQYRENRSECPRELRGALPGFKAALQERLNLSTIELIYIEADDTIAALVEQWQHQRPGQECVVVSTDKDLAQLICDDVLMFDHRKSQLRDAQWVRKKFGVDPAQLGDLLALMGDASDSVPGVRGVGPQKGADLLAQYGTLERVLEHADDIKGKLGESIREQADLARLSRRLVAFETDITLGVSWGQFQTGRARHSSGAENASVPSSTGNNVSSGSEQIGLL